MRLRRRALREWSIVDSGHPNQQPEAAINVHRHVQPARFLISTVRNSYAAAFACCVERHRLQGRSCSTLLTAEMHRCRCATQIFARGGLAPNPAHFHSLRCSFALLHALHPRVGQTRENAPVATLNRQDQHCYSACCSPSHTFLRLLRLQISCCAPDSMLGILPPASVSINHWRGNTLS